MFKLVALLQFLTRPIAVLACVAILVVQYAVMPMLAMKTGVRCPYMSDFVAGALVAKIIAYFIGRTAEKMKGAADVREV